MKQNTKHEEKGKDEKRKRERRKERVERKEVYLVLRYLYCFLSWLQTYVTCIHLGRETDRQSRVSDICGTAATAVLSLTIF